MYGVMDIERMESVKRREEGSHDPLPRLWQPIPREARSSGSCSGSGRQSHQLVVLVSITRAVHPVSKSL